jgi:hypothetical protein
MSRSGLRGRLSMGRRPILPPRRRGRREDRGIKDPGSAGSRRRSAEPQEERMAAFPRTELGPLAGGLKGRRLAAACQNLSIWVSESVMPGKWEDPPEVTILRAVLENNDFVSEGQLTSVTWASGTRNARVEAVANTTKSVQRRRGQSTCGNKKASH